jgi:tetratricopeptide (TPR) repeat protein
MPDPASQKQAAETASDDTAFGRAFEAKLVAWYETIRSHKFWAHATEPRTIWHAISFVFGWLYTVGSRLVWIFVIIVVGAIVYQGLAQQATVINPLSVPKILADDGITGEVAANRLRDAVTKYIEGAGSYMRSPIIALHGDLPNIVVPTVGISLDAVVVSVRTLLRSTRSRTVAGEITLKGNGNDKEGDKRFYLRLRLDGTEIYFSKNGATSDELEELFVEAVPTLLQKIKPYFVAAKLVRDNDDKALAFVDDVIEQLTPADPNKLRFADPDLAWFHSLRGVIYINSKDYKSAIGALEAAVSLNDKLAGAYENLGIAYANMAKADKNMRMKWNDVAEMEFLHAIALAPDFAIAHANYAEFLQSMGRYETAEFEACTAIGKDKSFAGAHYILARILADTGRSEEAIAHLKTALHLAPALKAAESELTKLQNEKVVAGSTPKSLCAFNSTHPRWPP